MKLSVPVPRQIPVILSTDPTPGNHAAPPCDKGAVAQNFQSNERRPLFQDRTGLDCASPIEFRLQQCLHHWMEHFDKRFNELMSSHLQSAFRKQAQTSDACKLIDEQPASSQYVSVVSEPWGQESTSLVNSNSENAIEPRASTITTTVNLIGEDAIEPRASIATATTHAATTSTSPMNVHEGHVLQSRMSVQAKLLELHSHLTQKRHSQISGPLSKYNLVAYPCFERLVACAIIMNGLLIGLRADLDGRSIAFDSSIFSIAEVVFIILFACELLLRICDLGSQWIRSAWNVFDALLVILQFSEFVVQLALEGLGGQDLSQDTASGKILSILRFASVLRLVRLLRFFPKLRVMVKMIALSLENLFWLMVLLLLIFYIASLLLTQGATEYIKNESNPDSDTLGIMKFYFGDMSKSILSLFKVTTNGISWGILIDELLNVSPLLASIFVTFVFFIFFSVLNVVTGVFVDGAIQHEAKERDALVEAEMKSLEKICGKLTELMVSIDIDASGTITKDELIQCAQDPKLSSYISALGVDAAEADRLFHYLDRDSSGEIDLQEFLDGCVKIRGEAKSKDLHLMMFAMEKQQSAAKDLLIATLKEVENMNIHLTTVLQSMMGRAEHASSMASVRVEPNVRVARNMAGSVSM